jgi:hypothetical protein
MEVVALFGIRNLDALSLEAANLQRAAMYRELMSRTAVSWPTARRHIVRACRRQRHPGWQPPAEWGGKREGAGAPEGNQNRKKG